MKYLHYNTEDFIADKKFKEWVLRPNEDLDHFWQSFIAQYPQKSKTIGEARQFIAGIRFPEPERAIQLGKNELEDMLQEVFELAGEDSGKLKKSMEGAFSLWARFNWVSRAASVLLFALSIGIVWSSMTNSPIPEQTVSIHEINKSAGKGQKLTVHLEDGTIVKLNSGSTITYPEHFDSVRVVHLEGEAFFDVAKDPKRPFEVYANDVKTTVLGTKFGISHAPKYGVTNIALLEGKVKVESVDNETSEHRILLPEQLVVYSSKQKTFKEGSYDYKAIFGWKDDILVFDHDGFDDVVRKLEDWYGVEIEVTKQISPEKDFSAEYHNQMLKNVLEGIAYSFEVECEIENKTVIIK